jgi:hypothetical protein
VANTLKKQGPRGPGERNYKKIISLIEGRICKADFIYLYY